MIDDGKNLEPPAEPFHRVQQPAVFLQFEMQVVAGGRPRASDLSRCAVRYVPFRLSLQGSGSCARTGWSIRPYGGCGRTSRNPGCSRRRSPGRFLPNIPARHTGPPGPPPCGISSALLRDASCFRTRRTSGSGYACRQEGTGPDNPTGWRPSAAALILPFISPVPGHVRLTFPRRFPPLFLHPPGRRKVTKGDKT